MADTKLSALSQVSVPDPDDFLYGADDPTGSPVSAAYTPRRILPLIAFVPGGRLTLTTAVPVTTADVTGAGTLYYTPYLHNCIRLWDGTRWIYRVFSEISLALTLTSGKNYDVFLDDDGATLSISTAWTDDTTRADALGTQDTIPVLNSDKTKLHLGMIRASGANTTEDSVSKRFLWNRYNRAKRALKRFETTDSWTGPASTTPRYGNNSSANIVGVVCGALGATEIDIGLTGLYLPTTSPTLHGIGEDSSNAFHADSTIVYTFPGIAVSAQARLTKFVPLGYHFYSWLEALQAGTTTGSGFGDTSGNNVNTGLHGWVEA